MSQPTRAGIVIIGGGQAGGWAAKTLRDRGYNGRLSVISDEPYDFYERPPLSKAALLDGSAPLSRLFSEEVVAGMNIDWHRPLRAEAIDGQQQIVTLSDGSQLQFDRTADCHRWPATPAGCLLGQAPASNDLTFLG